LSQRSKDSDPTMRVLSRERGRVIGANGIDKEGQWLWRSDFGSGSGSEARYEWRSLCSEGDRGTRWQDSRRPRFTRGSQRKQAQRGSVLEVISTRTRTCASPCDERQRRAKGRTKRRRHCANNKCKSANNKSSTSGSTRITPVQRWRQHARVADQRRTFSLRAKRRIDKI